MQDNQAGERRPAFSRPEDQLADIERHPAQCSRPSHRRLQSKADRLPARPGPDSRRGPPLAVFAGFIFHKRID
eukprot:scaffold14272_cov99-Isochrysis_galbana.AAC.2